MGVVVLDVVELGVDRLRLHTKGPRELLPDSERFALAAETIQDGLQRGALGQGEEGLLAAVRLWIKGQRDVVQLVNANPGMGQAIPDTFGRKSRPVLDAAKALLLDRCHQPPLLQQGGG